MQPVRSGLMARSEFGYAVSDSADYEPLYIAVNSLAACIHKFMRRIDVLCTIIVGTNNTVTSANGFCFDAVHLLSSYLSLFDSGYGAMLYHQLFDIRPGKELNIAHGLTIMF